MFTETKVFVSTEVQSCCADPHTHQHKNHTVQFHKDLQGYGVNVIWTFLLDRLPRHVLYEAEATAAPYRGPAEPRNCGCCPLTDTPLRLCVKQSLLTTASFLSWWRVQGSWWRWTRPRPASPCCRPPRLPPPSTGGCRCPSLPWRGGGSRCG